MKIFSGRMLIGTMVFFLTALSAQAYVLPTEQVLEFMAKALGPANGLAVTEQITMYPAPEMLAKQEPGTEETGIASPASLGDSNQAGESAQENTVQEPPPVPVTLEGSISYKFPENFREEIHYPTGLGIVVVSPAGVAKVEENYLISEYEDQYDLYKEPLLYRNSQLLMDRLSLAGVKTDTCSLGYWQGKVAYVIGAQYPDESVPQLWVEKNTFLPIRFIVTRTVPGRFQESLEVQYSEWQGLLVQDGKKIRHRYPGRIIFVSQERIISQRTLVNYAMNPSFPSDAFDILRMKKAYQLAPHLRETAPISQEMEGVRKALEVFKETTRQDSSSNQN